MNVKTIANEFGGDFVGLKIAPTRPGFRWLNGGIRLNRWVAWRAPRAMASWACPVCSRVAERDQMAARRQPADEIEGAIEFRSKRNDADIGPGASSAHDVAAAESVVDAVRGTGMAGVLRHRSAECAARAFKHEDG